MDEIRVVRALGPRDSPARTRPSTRALFRIAALQQRWHPDPAEHAAALEAGIRLAADQDAQLVCLPELTLSRYFVVDGFGPRRGGIEPEELPGGPTHRFAAGIAGETGIHIHASLFERADAADGLGFNTAILVAPTGELVARTRKLHIPVTAGYHEDRYFRPGPGGADAFPVIALADARLGLPTCWDQWFPELARVYSLNGADVLVYPTAIGSEPDHPEFDTQPLWEQVIVANGIANGLFMVAVNRFGEELPLHFYGSSFISDPYGRKLVQAPRDAPALLLADLDLDERRDWLELFPLLATRRPDAYGPLTELMTDD
ncbi:MAG TPA: nitrilase-related carbon-nitrogen hydrolase [Solirubrobacteraceae bacterium]|nr:nitrilase-related carbon-nitrogen hydrolase [Solirubrobacteraceae bacterium]